MKKPVRKTKEEIDAIVAKRKTLKRRETKSVPSGTIQNLLSSVEEFAAKFGATTEDVRIGSSWGYTSLVLNRVESPAEKEKRIRDEENSKYRTAKWRYDMWLQDQEREKENAATTLNRAVKEAKRHEVTIKCQCSCKCSK